MGTGPTKSPFVSHTVAACWNGGERAAVRPSAAWFPYFTSDWAWTVIFLQLSSWLAPARASWLPDLAILLGGTFENMMLLMWGNRNGWRQRDSKLQSGGLFLMWEDLRDWPFFVYLTTHLHTQATHIQMYQKHHHYMASDILTHLCLNSEGSYRILWYLFVLASDGAAWSILRTVSVSDCLCPEHGDRKLGNAISHIPFIWCAASVSDVRKTGWLSKLFFLCTSAKVQNWNAICSIKLI